MVGTHYTLERDKKPASRPTTKICRCCNVTKPNDFYNFGKKFHKTRMNFETVDVCLKCKNAKISDTFAKKRLANKAFTEAKMQELVERIKDPYQDKLDRQAEEDRILAEAERIREQRKAERRAQDIANSVKPPSMDEMATQNVKSVDFDKESDEDRRARIKREEDQLRGMY